MPREFCSNLHTVTRTRLRHEAPLFGRYRKRKRIVSLDSLCHFSQVNYYIAVFSFSFQDQTCVGNMFHFLYWAKQYLKMTLTKNSRDNVIPSFRPSILSIYPRNSTSTQPSVSNSQTVLSKSHPLSFIPSYMFVSTNPVTCISINPSTNRLIHPSIHTCGILLTLYPTIHP